MKRLTAHQQLPADAQVTPRFQAERLGLPGQPIIMRKHFAGNDARRAKTVCVTACLTALGVPFDNFVKTGPTGTKGHTLRANILRRNGWLVRSRKSVLKRDLGTARFTVANVRRSIHALPDPRGTFYMLVVEHSKTAAHMILIDSNGQTVVDTAPTKNLLRDNREIQTIHACIPKGGAR